MLHIRYVPLFQLSTVTCLDPDTANTFTFTLEGNTGNEFNVQLIAATTNAELLIDAFGMQASYCIHL